MKKMLAVLIMLTLVVSCLPTAFAEEGASTADATEPTSHILVVYFSATGTTKGVAEKLAEDIPFVRVDFYETGGRLYFGEMTLYPAGGLEEFVPAEWDRILGGWLRLPGGARGEGGRAG